MTERIYVALDLETTGLDASRDKIIEIGAVKFQGTHILDTFSTFICPNRPIPLRISQITGIFDDDVANAPQLEEMIPELRGFVDSDVAALVAHNASFDIGFLRAAGVNFHRPAQDTFHLSTILLPGRASYSLGQLCKEEGITLESAHRALDDATATAHLFARLQEALRSLPTSLIAEIIAVAESGMADQQWPPLDLFTDALKLGANRTPADLSVDLPADPPTKNGVAPTADQPELPEVATPTEPTYQPIDPDAVANTFAPKGSLSRLLGPAYEARAGQQQMARQVAEAFNSGESLIIEAGTGTGKSLAYLLPATLWSLQNERRVVVATNTIPLQEQLLHKDTPQLPILLQSLLPADASNEGAFEAALLKGRSNYLCMRRLNEWRRDRELSTLEMTVLARVLVWQQTTKTGDVSGLFLGANAEREIWLHLCSDPATCNAQRCTAALSQPPSLDRDERDYYLATYQNAASANLLIINHALLLADIASENSLLPPYDHLIIDETHHLEDAASDQLTFRVQWKTLQQMLAQLRGDSPTVRRLRLALESSEQVDESQRSQCYEQIKSIAYAATSIDSKIEEFAAQLLAFAVDQKGIRKGATFPQRLYLSPTVRNKPAWSQLETEWDLLSYELNELLKEVNQLIADLVQAGWRRVIELSSLVDKLGSMQEALDKMLLVTQRFNDDENANILWLQLTKYTAAANCNVTPRRVSDILEKELINKKRCTIFTGATLRAGQSFDFLGDRLGLWNVNASTVESPFDYEKNTLLYIPDTMPAPDQSTYQAAVEQAIIAAATATAGRTMALFTSHAHLRVTADAIRAPLDQLGITTLQHGSSGRRRLLREFRETEKAVLLGTRTFWEGVDLPGEDLQSLLIVKLPFAVPNDPLVAARSTEFDDGFGSYMLPDAILRFRQGFGRLIRRIDDRGAVVLLDSRIWQKSYGQAFLDALPPCTIRRAPLENIQGEIEAWMADHT